MKWEQLEKCCSEELLSLSSQTDLNKSCLLKVHMQLQMLVMHFQLMKSGISTKKYSLQLAAEHASVTVATVREWVKLPFDKRKNGS